MEEGEGRGGRSRRLEASSERKRRVLLERNSAGCDYEQGSSLGEGALKRTESVGEKMGVEREERSRSLQSLSTITSEQEGQEAKPFQRTI